MTDQYSADHNSGRIPLDQVAADQREAVRAFREAGEISYQHAPSIAAGRESAARASLAAALPPDDIASVTDVTVPATTVDGEFTVRIYDPATGAPESAPTDRPVVLYAHGGGWVIGSLDTHDSICRRLSSLSGLPVVSVGYRLAPEHPFPVPYTDPVDALAWIRDHSSAHGGSYHWNPQRVIVAGDSAGGSIAAGLASVPSMQVEGTTVIAQVLLYPSVDLAHETEAYDRVSAGFPLTADSVRWFADQLLTSREDAADPRASPLHWLRTGGPDGGPVTAEQPPAFILALGLDPLGTEAVDYATALTRCGTEVELHYLPHHAHGMANAAGAVATGERIIALAAGFISRHAVP